MKLKSGLIVSEVALAFVLLAATGLLVRSLYALEQVDTGIDSTNVITMNLSIDRTGFADGPQISNYYRQFQAVRSVPGVRYAANTSALPFQGWGYGMPFQIVGHALVNVASRPGCFFKMVSPSYFQALGIYCERPRSG